VIFFLNWGPVIISAGFIESIRFNCEFISSIFFCGRTKIYILSGFRAFPIDAIFSTMDGTSSESHTLLKPC
jgi:hypothetical protein